MDSRKVTALDPAGLGDWEDKIAQVVYMEATAPSTAVRDISVTVGYKGQATNFTATAVWFNYSGVARRKDVRSTRWDG
jgi:hypothetical protein